jgi:predicted xylose isomerase-like sugar epimerase
VEPFGFSECSLRSKETAIQAIRESGQDVYRIVHDTLFYSFEPFSSHVQQMTIKELSKALDESLELIQSLSNRRLEREGVE